MRLSVCHDTHFQYEEAVRASIQYVRLTPRSSARQRVLDWQLDLPAPARVSQDPYGNILHVLTLDTPHDHIDIVANGRVDIDRDVEVERDEGSPLPYLRYTDLTRPDEALSAFARAQSGRPVERTALIRLMEALHDVMVDEPFREPLPAGVSFQAGRGGSADHTHLFLACARSLGVPARFVSGYLYTEGREGLASHTWAEAWLKDGWYTFDVTERLTRPERHLKLAVGLDHLDACPVRGVRRGGGLEQMKANVRVLAQQLRQQ